VHPVGSYCTDISRCTVNKTLDPDEVHVKDKQTLKTRLYGMWSESFGLATRYAAAVLNSSTTQR